MPSEGLGPSDPRLSHRWFRADWVCEVEIASAGDPAHAVFLFATQSDHESRLELNLYENRLELVRVKGLERSTLATYAGAGPPPWRLRVVRRGAYYIFELNNAYVGFTFHPSADVGLSSSKRIAEPATTRLGLSFPSPGHFELRSFVARPISFGKRQEVPAISPGPKGSWNQAETFPGAIIRDKGMYYLYLNGTDWTSTALEGGGNTRVGLATSRDLRHWNVDPSGVILGLGPTGAWDSTLVMVNGATRTRAGRFAVTYMGFNGKTWSGIGLATADHPDGPFVKYPGNPVLRTVPGSWEIMIHEHTLYREGSHYILMYTGFDGKQGDHGGLAESDDLIHWRKDPANPVFLGVGPGRWDSLHLRPRSLFRHGEYYYLFYEGAGTRTKFSAVEGGVQHNDQLVFDSIGLARSRDLHKWERFPWNPALPQTGQVGFDALWTGWPLAVVTPKALFVFYAASDAWGFAKKQGRVSTGLMRFDYKELERWGNGPAEKR